MTPNPLIWLFCESTLYGIYIVIFIGCMAILILKRGRTAANIIMIAVGFIMFLLSTAHISLNLFQFITLSTRRAIPEDTAPHNPRNMAQFAMEGANYIIGDAVVIWRLWAVWNRDLRICIVPVSFLVGAAGAAVGGVYSMSLIGPINPRDVARTPLAKWGLAFIVLTLSTNICATALITWRARFYFRRLTPDTERYGNKGRRILVLFIESGAVYCATWIVAVVLWAVNSLNWHAVTSCLSQLTGIYPTAIIVMVSVNQTIASLLQTHPTLSSSHVPTPLSTHHLRPSMHTAVRRKHDSPLIIHVDTSARRSFQTSDDCSPLSAPEMQLHHLTPVKLADEYSLSSGIGRAL